MWFWVVLWAVLILCAGAVFGLLGWQLLGKARALIAESRAASEQLTTVLSAYNEAADPSGRPPGPYPVASPSSPESPRRGYRRPRPH